MNKESVTEVRADVWLWAARFFKTRSLAKQMLSGGKVEIGGQPIKPSRLLRAGDVLRIARVDGIYDITVLALSETRGPAPVARSMRSSTVTSAAAS